MDKHERLVPDIMEWYLTECDINKDIKVSDWFHYTSIKIQVKHLDHLFKVYIKEMGKDTVWRVEESKAFTAKKSAIEVINDVFNPNEKLEKEMQLLATQDGARINLAEDDSNSQNEPESRTSHNEQKLSARVSAHRDQLY